MKDQAEGITAKAEAILDPAVQLFIQFGYRRTTMDDVARRAGVAKGTLYLYFDSKAALFRAMQSRDVAASQRLCEEAEARGGALADLLFGQLEAWFGMMHARYGASDHLSELSTALTTVGADIAKAADAAYEARLVRLLDRAAAQGDVSLEASGLDARRTVTALLAAARGAKFADGKSVKPEIYRRRLRDIARLFAAAVRAR